MDAMGLKDAVVQKFGGENEFLIRVEKAAGDLEAMSKSIQTSLQERFKDKALGDSESGSGGSKGWKRFEDEGHVGRGLRFCGILIYVAFRFHEFSYGLGGHCCPVSRCQS